MSILLVAGASVALVALGTRLLMAPLYDMLIVKMTARWYAAVLARLPQGSLLLDIGIGTATALTRNADAVRSKRLSVVGIDYEASYIRRAETQVASAGLADLVSVHCRSIFDELADLRPHGRQFDSAYFSGSLTLMPDPPEALRAAVRLVVPGGPIFVTQTFQNIRSPLMEHVKPLLRLATTVDFGVVTYHSQIMEIAAAAGLAIAEDTPIEGSINTPYQTARLIVLRAT